MKFLFFGAGASYGAEGLCANPLPAPPLGDNLFSELLKHNPLLWGKAQPTFSLYKGFEEPWYKFRTEVLQDDFVPLMEYLQDLGRYFFSFELCEHSLYMTLAQKIKNSWKESDGAIATLNYDVLLQIALTYHNTGFEAIVPHGSCHRLCNLEDLIIAGSNTRMLSPNYRHAEQTKIFNRDKHASLLAEKWIPLMAHYDKHKRSSINHEVLEHQKALFVDYVQRAETIAIVGVAFIEHDVHIWEPFLNTKAKIVYVNPGHQDNQKFSNWAGKNNLNFEIVAKTFVDGFVDICQVMELN